MVAETPVQQAGAIIAVGQAQKSASGSVVNQADIEQVKKLLTQVWCAAVGQGCFTAYSSSN